jgi:hypothetical protein
MKNRRVFLLTLIAGAVTLVVVAAPVIADELFGVLTKVDVEGKKLTIIEKDTDKEVVITVTDDTEAVSKKGSSKVDLEKLAKGIEKAKDAGKQGIQVKVEHDKKVASKLYFARKKKAE